MKIKDQAKAALEIDPFAKTFICTKVCVKEGCDCYVRRTVGSYACLDCSKNQSDKWRKANSEKASKIGKDWYQENKEYCVKKAYVNKLLRREARGNEAIRGEQR